MTPAEVRAVVERVVLEHGGGWQLAPATFWWELSDRSRSGMIKITIDGGIDPCLHSARGDAACARAVALWPEMQRLGAMLREALR